MQKLKLSFNDAVSEEIGGQKEIKGALDSRVSRKAQVFRYK